MSHKNGPPKRVVVVGGGFGGLGCARSLADHEDVHVTLIDRNNYHQFQPLLYQVATSVLPTEDVAFPLREVFKKEHDVEIKLGEVTAVDPRTKTVSTATGETYQGDFLVLAAGSQPNFFKTPGAEHAFPLYSVEDAERLRTRIISAFEEADRDDSLIEDGVLNFVIVGGGATGTEIAGAIADMIHGSVAASYPDLALSASRVFIYDHGDFLLAPFSEGGHEYAAKILQKNGVRLRLGHSIKEVGAGHVVDSEGTTIRTRCVIWAGGIKAAPRGELGIASRARRQDRRPARSDRRRLPRGVRHRRFCQCSEPRWNELSTARVGGTAKRSFHRQSHPEGNRGQAARLVPLHR